MMGSRRQLRDGTQIWLLSKPPFPSSIHGLEASRTFTMARIPTNGRFKALKNRSRMTEMGGFETGRFRTGKAETGRSLFGVGGAACGLTAKRDLARESCRSATDPMAAIQPRVARAPVSFPLSLIHANNTCIVSRDASWLERVAVAAIGSAVQSSRTTQR